MRKIIIIITLALFPSLIWGQVEYMEEKNQVSAIKKDANYIYGEGVGDTEEDANAVAESFLLSEIKRTIQENIPVVEAGSISPEQVLKNACIIKFKRGTMDRIFLYLKKDNIQNSVPCETKVEEVAPAEVLAVQEPIVEVEDKGASIDYLDSMVQALSAVFEQKDINELDETSLSMLAYIAANAVDTEKPDTTPEIVSEPVVTLPENATWLDKFVSAPDVTTLLKYLKEAKDEHKVMWGEVKSRIEITWYVVPINGNRIEAILNPSRVDLRTGTQKALVNYNSNKKLWFIIYE